MPDLYRDPAAGIGERVTDLLGRMTIEEKAAQSPLKNLDPSQMSEVA